MKRILLLSALLLFDRSSGQDEPNPFGTPTPQGGGTNTPQKASKPEKPVDIPQNNELVGTLWEFLRHDRVRLGTVRLMPDGTFESKRYGGGTWHKTDTGLAWSYGDSGKVDLDFYWTSPTEMKGRGWATRYLVRIPERQEWQASPKTTITDKKLPQTSEKIAKLLGVYLERLLSPLDQTVPPSNSEVSTLRRSIETDARNAGSTGQPSTASALKICDALLQIIDERQKAIANLQRNLNVTTSSGLGARRALTPTWEDIEREKMEARVRQGKLEESKAQYRTQANSKWIQRAFILRNGIYKLQTKLKEEDEKESKAAK